MTAYYNKVAISPSFNFVSAISTLVSVSITSIGVLLVHESEDGGGGGGLPLVEDEVKVKIVVAGEAVAPIAELRGSQRNWAEAGSQKDLKRFFKFLKYFMSQKEGDLHFAFWQ